MNNLRIGYFADGPWSHKALNLILNDSSVEVAFVCGRYKSTDIHLREIAEKNGIKYFTERNINDEKFIEYLKQFECCLFVSMSFNQIFKKNIINLTEKGIINCHAGKLPFYRGRNVLNWVLINDESEFGVTVHYVDEGIDTGDIILQKTFQITEDDNYRSLLNKAYNSCAELLYESLQIINKKEIVTKRQIDIHPVGMYCSKRKEGDEFIDWNMSSREIFNFIRALHLPGLYAKTRINSKEVTIKRARLIEDAVSYRCINGAVLDIKNNNLLVKTNDSYLEITDFECAQKIKIGDRLI